MRRLYIAALLAAASLAALARPTFAEPLDAAHVPAEARWVLHFDFQAFHRTLLVKHLEEQRPEAVERARQWLEQRYGIDPKTDLFGLTAFSDTYEDHTGAAVLLAHYNPEKVRELMKRESGVEETTWEGKTLYTIARDRDGRHAHDKSGERGEGAESRRGEINRDEARIEEGRADRPEKKEGREESREEQARDEKPAHREREAKREGTASETEGPHSAAEKEARRVHEARRVAILLVDDTKIVIASSADRAKDAAKVLLGQSPSLKGANSPLVEKAPEGSVAYGAAVDLSRISEHSGVFPILRQHERANYAVGNNGQEIFEELTLVAASEPVAQDMEKVFQGFDAFLRVWAADDAALKDLAKDFKVSREGPKVSFEYRGEIKSFVNAFEAFGARMRMWDEAKHGEKHGAKRERGGDAARDAGRDAKEEVKRDGTD